MYRSALTMREVAQQVGRTTEDQAAGFGRIRENVSGVRGVVEEINSRTVVLAASDGKTFHVPNTAVLNHTIGRYGLTLDGVWYPNTDYSDPRVREAILAEVSEMVAEFQDSPGWALEELRRGYGAAGAVADVLHVGHGGIDVLAVVLRQRQVPHPLTR